MIYIISVCGWGWILPWLLPFLLGLALGYLLWAHWKNRFRVADGELVALQSKHDKLRADFDESTRLRTKLEGDIKILKGQQDEFDHKLLLKNKEIESLNTTIATTAKESVDTHELDDLKAQLAEANLHNEQLAQRIYFMENDEDFYGKSGNVDMGLGLVDTGSSDDSDALQKDNDRLNVELKDANLHIEQLEKRLDLMENDADFYGKSGNVVSSLTLGGDSGVADGLKSENSRLTNELTDAQSLIAKLKGQIKDLESSAQFPVDPDDLTKIEGIGPKIQQILNESNIYTWRKLSQTPVKRIEEILDAAGPRFKLAVPTTWPKQAALAADGKWDELEKWQDELDGGR